MRLTLNKYWYAAIGIWIKCNNALSVSAYFFCFVTLMGPKPQKSVNLSNNLQETWRW